MMVLNIKIYNFFDIFINIPLVFKFLITPKKFSVNVMLPPHKPPCHLLVNNLTQVYTIKVIYIFIDSKLPSNVNKRLWHIVQSTKCEGKA